VSPRRFRKDDSPRQDSSPGSVTSPHSRVSASPPRWALTQEAFDRLLTQLDPDRARAAEKYEELRRKLMKFFKWRGCLQFEEYADKTIDRVARKITEGAELQATSPSALFYGVALLLVKEHWRKTATRQEIPASQTEAWTTSEDPEKIRAQAETLQEQETRLACLRRCLAKLPSESVYLIKKYYSEGDVLDKQQRKQIALQLNLSATALRSRAFRVRGELERCVNNCLEEVE
jgi:DNA-directed RNA polymerase specialized sigma24 family protein